MAPRPGRRCRRASACGRGGGRRPEGAVDQPGHGPLASRAVVALAAPHEHGQRPSRPGGAERRTGRRARSHAWLSHVPAWRPPTRPAIYRPPSGTLAWPPPPLRGLAEAGVPPGTSAQLVEGSAQSLPSRHVSRVPHLEPRHPEGEELLHNRDYRVDVYRAGPSTMRIRGQLRDVKPNGLELLLEDDTPMVIHHMVVDLLVEVPSLEITAARPVMETHPHHDCTCVLAHYQGLVGLSIARGFTHKVRELFGGPRGCTHTTMLLQAMAPVAIQSLWSYMRPEPGESRVELRPRQEQHREHFARNRNTCHVWADGGPMAAHLERDEDLPMPIWAEKRLADLGIDPEVWVQRASR
ncbi:MAG: DUF2889 domain-containing protein [Acidimicrobiia bacterium]|nr:DUF2889 domain-containing protein [Acidimicrobiia bacterium]